MLPRDWAARLSDLRRELDRPALARHWQTVSAHAEQLRAYLAVGIDPAPPTGDGGTRWLRPKGNLTRGALAALIAIAVAPLILMVIRISAMPGVLGPGWSGSLLPSIGHDLNQFLSLHEIPADDRGRVLYLLFLPTGAMLIALARLTFGLRVIGFRSILIALGFQQSGVVPSIILIAVVVGIVIGIRPMLVRVRLPYYARVSVIVTLSVIVLLAALLVAPWMRSDVLWRVGFFPVIVLGLLAEGIAKTLDQHSGLTALWRTGMTLGIGLLLAGIGQIPALREVAIHFPELVLTQLVAVVMISEFLDLRLFQDLDARLSGIALPRLFAKSHALRVAVVRNHRRNGTIGRIGALARGGTDRRSLRRIVAALRAKGHTVEVFEGDMLLLSKLRQFIPPHPRTGQPGGLVLNLSHGIQGELPSVHVPAMLEMSGVAYTGPSPRGCFVLSDKALAASVLHRAGVRTPDLRVYRSPDEVTDDLAYPVIVKPRFASRYKLRVAADRRQLEDAVLAVTRRDRQQAVVERFVSGREIQVALVGNDPVQCLPLVEVRPGTQERACPASLEPSLEREVREAAIAAFAACECRDYALVDVRISRAGTPYVLEIGQVDVLEPGGAFDLAAEAAGLPFDELIDRIVGVARERVRASVEAPGLALVPRDAEEGREPGRAIFVG